MRDYGVAGSPSVLVVLSVWLRGESWQVATRGLPLPGGGHYLGGDNPLSSPPPRGHRNPSSLPTRVWLMAEQQ